MKFYRAKTNVQGSTTEFSDWYDAENEAQAREKWEREAKASGIKIERATVVFEEYDKATLKPIVEALARAFSRILKEWLGASGIERIVRENSTEIEPSICHSHDQCDANQAMLYAWEELFGKDVVPASIRSDATEAEEQESDLLWDGAWAMAKRECFWGPTKITPHSVVKAGSL